MNSRGSGGSLFAISDLHVGLPENRRIVEEHLFPETDADWLLVAGDVGEYVADIEWAVSLLRERFGTVVWVPGNHELWTMPQDDLGLRGETRYSYLVDLCRRLGVITPEDPYPVFSGVGGEVTVVPLFLLYDYSFRVAGAATKERSLEAAYEAGVVCNDEFLLHPDPYPSREAWCWARIAETERRLADCDPDIPTVLVNHFPLVREPTRILRYPQFAQWCGSELTADWHLRFRAEAVVYGHLHIPRTTWHDGVRFEEVSVGYPREWRKRSSFPSHRRVLFDTEDRNDRRAVAERGQVSRGFQGPG
jgi:3',5'-cyclic AMP phosphodiesterase CpdA